MVNVAQRISLAVSGTEYTNLTSETASREKYHINMSGFVPPTPATHRDGEMGRVGKSFKR